MRSPLSPSLQVFQLLLVHEPQGVNMLGRAQASHELVPHTVYRLVRKKAVERRDKVVHVVPVQRNQSQSGKAGGIGRFLLGLVEKKRNGRMKQVPMHSTFPGSYLQQQPRRIQEPQHLPQP